jgi:hypothetical protein
METFNNTSAPTIDQFNNIISNIFILNDNLKLHNHKGVTDSKLTPSTAFYNYTITPRLFNQSTYNTTAAQDNDFIGGSTLELNYVENKMYVHPEYYLPKDGGLIVGYNMEPVPQTDLIPISQVRQLRSFPRGWRECKGRSFYYIKDMINITNDELIDINLKSSHYYCDIRNNYVMNYDSVPFVIDGQPAKPDKIQPDGWVNIIKENNRWYIRVFGTILEQRDVTNNIDESKVYTVEHFDGKFPVGIGSFDDSSVTSYNGKTNNNLRTTFKYGDILAYTSSGTYVGEYEHLVKGNEFPIHGYEYIYAGTVRRDGGNEGMGNIPYLPIGNVWYEHSNPVDRPVTSHTVYGDCSHDNMPAYRVIAFIEQLPFKYEVLWR